MKQSIKQSGQNLIHPKQWIGRSSIQVTTKSSHIESYLLTHSIFPPFHHHSTSPSISPMRCDHSLLPVESPKSKQTEASSPSPTVSIPLCKLASASLNQFSVCRWVLASRWIIPNKQSTKATKYFLPSLLLYNFQCGIQGFNIHTLFYFLSSPHSMHSKINE